MEIGIEITKQRKDEVEIKKQRMIENAIYKMKNSNRQDQSAARNKLKVQGPSQDKHAKKTEYCRHGNEHFCLLELFVHLVNYY